MAMAMATRKRLRTGPDVAEGDCETPECIVKCETLARRILACVRAEDSVAEASALLDEWAEQFGRAIAEVDPATWARRNIHYPLYEEAGNLTRAMLDNASLLRNGSENQEALRTRVDVHRKLNDAVVVFLGELVGKRITIVSDCMFQTSGTALTMNYCSATAQISRCIARVIPSTAAALAVAWRRPPMDLCKSPFLLMDYALWVHIVFPEYISANIYRRAFKAAFPGVDSQRATWRTMPPPLSRDEVLSLGIDAHYARIAVEYICTAIGVHAPDLWAESPWAAGTPDECDICKERGRKLVRHVPCGHVACSLCTPGPGAPCHMCREAITHLEAPQPGRL